MMPDNPIIVDAIANNKILIGNKQTPQSEKHIDENGIVSEIVPTELRSDRPNWECSFCGYQNRFEDTTCRGCNAGKESSEKDYFSNKPVMDEQNRADYEHRTGTAYEEPDPQHESSPEIPTEQNSISIFTIIRDFLLAHIKPICASISIVLCVALLIWLFIPITRVSTIKHFEWERNIEVERYTLCHESDWSVPPGGEITDTKEQIHHYDHVLDHYETKTKKVSEKVIDHYETKTKTHTEKVLDGYDTHYEDLGNGQAKLVKTPKYRTETITEEYKEPVYKTVYHTETYKDPVYVDIPVYKTKYYYDIGRWKAVYDLGTTGCDQNPYWHETDIPESISDPEYNDERLGKRSEAYYAIIIDDNEEVQKVKYDFEQWSSLEIGGEITYKTFRFSHKPL